MNSEWVKDDFPENIEVFLLVLPKRDPAACHSTVNKEAKLVEKKACFILMPASQWEEGKWTPVQRLTPHHPQP